MVELNDEDKKELLIGIRKDVSDILRELVGNIRKDVLEIIETNFYDDVKYEIVLEKTEKLLKNYKSLREHINNIKITKLDIKEAEESQIRQMMKNLFTDDELYFEKLYKSKANTEILVRFLEKTVEIGENLKAIYNNKSSIDEIIEIVKQEVKTGINKDKEIEKFEQHGIGKCPCCDSNIIENDKSFYCENWKNCGFSVWKIICGKKITANMIKEILERGYTKKMKGFKSKAGKSFEASLVLENDKVKFNFD